MSNIAILSNTEKSNHLALIIKKEIPEANIFSTCQSDTINLVVIHPEQIRDIITKYKFVIFIGELDNCVRSIANEINGIKPLASIINIDLQCRYIQSVISDPKSNVNSLVFHLASITGGEAIISTNQRVYEEWDLLEFPSRFEWDIDIPEDKDIVLRHFSPKHKIALLLEINDKGAAFLERTSPSFVEIFYQFNEIDKSKYDLIIAVTPLIHDFGSRYIVYRPKVFTLGLWCHKNFSLDLLISDLKHKINSHGISFKSIRAISTSDSRKNEQSLIYLSEIMGVALHSYSADVLNSITIPNPSEVIAKHTGFKGVAESAALAACNTNNLIVEKQNDHAGNNQYYSWAMAIDEAYIRRGHIEIVGTGSGDPDLISVKGKYYIERADLILHPKDGIGKDLLGYIKEGALVRSFDVNDIHQQLEMITSFYKKGLLIVVLYSGDPAVFENVVKQVNILDKNEFSFGITSGISTFQSIMSQINTQYFISKEYSSISLQKAFNDDFKLDNDTINKDRVECIYVKQEIAHKLKESLLEKYDPNTPVFIGSRFLKRNEKVKLSSLQSFDTHIKDGKFGDIAVLIIGLQLSQE